MAGTPMQKIGNSIISLLLLCLIPIGATLFATGFQKNDLTNEEIEAQNKGRIMWGIILFVVGFIPFGMQSWLIAKEFC